MRKGLVGILLLVLCTLPLQNAYAAKSVCVLPKDCTYLDSEFSTGGGNKASYVMEVTCKSGNKIVKYTAWNLSPGGFLKMGRFTAPKKIEFVKGSEDSLKCQY